MRTSLQILVVWCAIAGAGETPLDRAREAVAASPQSIEARWAFAQAAEKAGQKGQAQTAAWQTYLMASGDPAVRSKARATLLRLDKSWQAVFDAERAREKPWREGGAGLATKHGVSAEDIMRLWSRIPCVVDESWRSTRDPLEGLQKLVMQWQGGKTLGKGGVAVLDMPVRRKDGLVGRSLSVKALEVLIEGKAIAKNPEVDVTVQIGPGDLAWGAPGEEPKSPIWVHVRRLEGDFDEKEPVSLWLRYYPQRGIGAGAPRVDARMRGADASLKLDAPLGATVRVEALPPRVALDVSRITLTLYVQLQP
jgi:hypothetical protein